MSEIQNIYLANMNAVCNLGGFFKTNPDTEWRHRLHSFTQNKFYFITKGTCMIQVENTQYIAKVGDWFYIPANTIHCYSTIEGETFEKYWMHFDIYPDNGISHTLNLPPMINVGNNKEVYRLFKKFRNVHDSNELCDCITEKAVVIALISEYIRIAHPEGVSVANANDDRIDEIIRYINNNLSDSLSVSELAGEFHLHPNHFIRYFKNKTGQTPARYIKAKKMETAKRLLEDSDLTISQITEKIGETDISSFSKQFKTLYALSPKEYRKFFLSTKVAEKI